MWTVLGCILTPAREVVPSFVFQCSTYCNPSIVRTLATVDDVSGAVGKHSLLLGLIIMSEGASGQKVGGEAVSDAPVPAVAESAPKAVAKAVEDNPSDAQVIWII